MLEIEPKIFWLGGEHYQSMLPQKYAYIEHYITELELSHLTLF
jgi:hypothetical protein